MKQALLSRFEAFLDTAEAADDDEQAEAGQVEAGQAWDGPVEHSHEAADLYSVFVEVAGLRTEVRTQSRLVKDALEQFRGAFDALQASHDGLQQELDRARAAARDQANAALRPLLLDVIDVRDRLMAALKFADAPRETQAVTWIDRMRGRRAPAPSAADGWQDGLRMTLRRLDQMLLDRRVTVAPLAGRPFDPRRARVVGTAPDGSVPEGTVIEEVRSGFLWDDQVLRTADVIVSKREAAQGDRP